MVRNMVRNMVLRARRVLKNSPAQLKIELKFILDTFCSDNNGYPRHIVTKWMREFESEFQRNPALLTVRSRLNFEELFDDFAQQQFVQPTAAQRFPPVDLDPEEDMELSAERRSNQQQARTDGRGILDEPEMDPEMDPDTATAVRHRKQLLLIPFVPGISDKLKTIAGRFGVPTWYTYPGRGLDRFTQHRGRTPISKTQNTVYCCQCSCGIQYVGESGRNLKIRVAEHTNIRSNSTLSEHLNANLDHSLSAHNTIVLAREKNLHKRKLIETICIDHKAPKLCNAGLSIAFPAAWKLCTDGISRELRCMD